MDSHLSNEEIMRYGRQLILPEFGMKRQQLLKSQSALIVGCGGLGCPAAIYLAAAGIGTLGLLDHDEVEVSNLHRQILHKECGTGVPKCDSARAACRDINSLPTYNIHNVAIDSSNARDIIKQYSVVLDCTDNVATRYLLNDACVLEQKPLISGAALKFEGQLTVYNYKEGPCYRCLYPTPPPAHMVTSCSEGGVMGFIPGIIGTMQAQEAIKVVTQMEGTLAGRLFLYDGLSFTTRIVKLRSRQASCSVCGNDPSITTLIDYVEFCGSASASDKLQPDNGSGKKRISVKQYKTDYIDQKSTHLLIDTRPNHETEICKLSHSSFLNIPLKDLTKLSRLELLDVIRNSLAEERVKEASTKGAPLCIVCVCHHGNDSQVAAKYLDKLDVAANVVDIIGGLNAWANHVDRSFPKY